MRRKLFTFAAAVSALLCVAVCGLWVRSHLVRDYAFAFLPWPGDAAGERYLKLDADTGGGQVEFSWKVWTAAQREQVRQHNELAGAGFYHRAFPDVPRQYARSSP